MPEPRVTMLPEVAAQRHALADLLDTLDRDEWSAPSLCLGWTVHDVLAHLTLSTRQSTAGMVLRILRARGDFDRAEARAARERAAAHPPATLTAQLRETAAVDRRVGLSSPRDPLVDVLVHGQDIARPLRRRLPTPPELAVPALRHVWSNVFYGRPSRRLHGVRLIATDTAWSEGAGPEVCGTAGDLLLLATGRSVSASGVTGAGVGEVAARLRS
ncbi:maleylpyruvate isomerase family mycothiol-dependent enzyme [Modestobacter sp. VKM Ac-2983]|uniref:maleylpyruvate isomerase family mycothiol-dependent enzyme n=1 Tax=Modestobacter sp. VKM Ac-2983 TaxID=3004137 RepID=UPI0022AB6A19|nr:maleylpyruvate isomerase family mycothiol-dependent enzyme [Modestobacter sp. VKM Ac-2983]MCZ2806442.1 maleylpyruvate isomerase family mycothiol-dependent enzyme [Modestobacter sp. VKM Ac-2983]